MKNLRKLSATVLAALVITSMTAVFAADSATIANADKAATLKDLGLYAGTDATNVAAGLDGALTTQDSLIFLAKLFGYNEAASALTSDQVAESLTKFDDAASISEYAKNVVAYSATNNILSGSPDGDKLFAGAKDTVTAARFATFMLKQMDYNVVDYKQSVAELAASKGSKVDTTITGDLTRDDAVGMMYAALTAEKASGKTVIADIVGDNADLKAKAEKLGLIAPIVITDVAVVSVKAINTKQIAVSFNQEMDKDSVESENFYEIYDKGENKVELSDSSASLDADKKTVIITLNKNVADKLTNSSQAKVIVKKEILAGRGVKLAEDAIFDKFDVQDGLLPTVTKVEATGERNIKITFSEPVYDKGNDNSIAVSNFKVVSGTYTYYVQKATLDNNVIKLEIGTKLIEGPVTVTVNDAGPDNINAIVDYAGYGVFKGNTTFSYIKDTSGADVTVKSAKANKVVLNFSKPVKGSHIKLYYSEKNNESYKAEVTKTDYTDKITFIFNRSLPSGNLNLYLVNSETEGEKLIDRDGIYVPDQSLTCDVEEVPDQSPTRRAATDTTDTTAPVVKQCIVNRNESITIIFNEKINRAAATNPDNYVVKKLPEGEGVSLSAKIDESRKSVELKFNSKLEGSTEYQLLIKEYKDIYGNRNASEYIYDFTTLEDIHPEVIDDPENDQDCCTIAKKGKIIIVYSEAMDEEQMLDKGNYQVSIDQGVTYMDLGDDGIITKVNDRTVKIFFKQLEGTDINPYVKLSPIMDLAGNKLYDSDEHHIVENIKPENVYIEQAQLIAKNKIRIVFNKKMELVDFNDFKSTTPGAISVKGCESTTVNSDGKTEVVLILSNELTTDAKDKEGEWVSITTAADPSSKSEWGSKLESDSCFGLLDDWTSPEIVMWDHDNDVETDDIAKVIVCGDITNPQYYDNNYTVQKGTTGIITIFFSEAIKDSTSTLTVDTFNVPGFTITDITAPDETKTVVLTVEANADNIPVKTTVTQVSEIYDKDGNAFAPGSTWTVTLEDKHLTT